tara:strand:+ start:600 stop:1385 length:786 start_codon:yes stop_codon:yes gene_type:complete
MRKKNFSQQEREKLEEQGQMNIFDMIQSGENPEDIVAQAESEIEERQEVSEPVVDNPIGLKTEGNNMDIEEMIETSEETVEEELKEEVVSEVENTPSEEELSEILNKGFEKEEAEAIVEEDVDYEYFNLDEFAGSEPSYDDRLVAFDTSLETTDPKFVIVASKDDFESIKDFKFEFSGQGGLNEHLIIAFPLKAEGEPERVVAMLEKKLASTHKIDKKEADKEAKRIAELEASGIETEETIEGEEAPKQKRRGRPSKPKNK